jgi:hypothetical protein
VLLMAGIRERDKRAVAGSASISDSLAYRNFVPRLVYVRNMFFLAEWGTGLFRPLVAGFEVKNGLI